MKFRHREKIQFTAKNGDHTLNLWEDSQLLQEFPSDYVTFLVT